MKHAIHELRAIAANSPLFIQEQIEKWIKDNIKEAHYEVKLHKPNNPEHAEYNIKQAMCELGKHIAENSNMYPKWIETKQGYEMRVSALYFKNEFGK